MQAHRHFTEDGHTIGILQVVSAALDDMPYERVVAPEQLATARLDAAQEGRPELIDGIRGSGCDGVCDAKAITNLACQGRLTAWDQWVLEPRPKLRCRSRQGELAGNEIERIVRTGDPRAREGTEHALTAGVQDAHQVEQLHAVSLNRRGAAEEHSVSAPGDGEHELQKAVRRGITARAASTRTVRLVEHDAGVPLR